MSSLPHWSDVLSLRPEVVASDGGVGDLQMSLHKAVYQTVEAPYRDVGYYAAITQPTPTLVGFFSRVARRLSGLGERYALYHLDQGMGGGKSHALVGLYHLAASPSPFFATELGQAVRSEAEADGASVELRDVRVVTLTADHFSPGKPSEIFGPAVNLFERFLWGLFDGDRARWDRYVAMGPNKATLQQALLEVGRPVLILLDELMDYAMELSDAGSVGAMPGEQAFLNALMDACDDVPRVVLVVVMIRSELDPEGYTPLAEEFREYIGRRLNRSGTTVSVIETLDFAAIIRRRIFEQVTERLPTEELARAYDEAVAADRAWEGQVLDRLGSGKGLPSLAERIARTYPFHPDLMDLVQTEWARVQGFQRVRSTVRIFALTALYWHRGAKRGEWAPPLIGVGYVPLNVALETVLSSGLLLGNDRAIQGFRAVATTDITSSDGTGGRAVALDRQLAASKVRVGQPCPAVRMATALFAYSLVARDQGRFGATKAELMTVLLLPAGGEPSPFSAAEEVFFALTDDEGLGALEIIRSARAPERYRLTIKQTLRMFFNSARASVQQAEKLALVWEMAQNLATKGSFEELHFVDRPGPGQDLPDVAGRVDSQSPRLVVLDPREWTLLNGADESSREVVRRILGLGTRGLIVDNAASCVLAAANTQRRRYAVEAAEAVLTWKLVQQQVVEEDELAQVSRELEDAEKRLKAKVRETFQHYAYLVRRGDGLEVQFSRFDEDTKTSLSGNDVWSALVVVGRAVGKYDDPEKKRREERLLSEAYVAALLDTFDRHLTLKEITTSFYQNPAFPLVPSVAEIRRVLFGLIQPPEHAGEGTGGWELIDGNGARLEPQNPDQLVINSIQQQLRRLRVAESISVADQPAEATATGTGGEGRPTGEETPRDTDGPSAARDRPATDGRATYSWYRMELLNRSIADPARREQARKVLVWLAATLDDDALDHQLLTLKLELNAASSKQLEMELEQRAKELETPRWSVEEEF